jgi:cysteinyl-tRNA synthetase
VNLAVLCALVALPLSTEAPSGTTIQSARQRLNQAQSWFYQLQDVDIDTLGESEYDVIVLDLEDDNRQPWQPRIIESLRNGKNRKRVILAYISVGEAEKYRSYWQPEWFRRRPAWIGRENRSWKGNYAVKYWSAEWRQVLFNFGGMFDKAIGAGFDGVYLDRLDAYMDWGPTGSGKKHREASAKAMVDLVQDIANHTRRTRSVPEFLIVGQNAPLLCKYPKYVATVDGVALEDLFYYRRRGKDGARRSRSYTRYIIEALQPIKEAQRPIFVVDYLPKYSYRKRYSKLSRKYGLVPFAAPSRALDRLP